MGVGINEIIDRVQMKVDYEILLPILNLKGQDNYWSFTHIRSAYITSSRQSLGEMKIAVTQQDKSALIRSAHKLRGSSSNLGAKHISRLCADIECSINQLNLSDMTNKIGMIEEEMENFEALLKLL